MQRFLRGDKNTFLLFFAVAFLLFGNSIRNSFSFDDSYVTVTNARVPNQKYVPDNALVGMGFKGIPKIWKTRYGHGKGTAYDYRPVVTTLFAIEYAVFGQSPHLNHFMNVLLYATLLYVMFLVLVKCLSAYEYRQYFALLACLLFASHPIHTEVVDSLKCRDELMALLFSFLSMWTVLRFMEGKEKKYAVLAFLFLFLAVLSKLSAAVLIIIIPMMLFVFDKIKLKHSLLFVGAGFFVLILQMILKRVLVEEKDVRILFHFENPLATEHLNFFEKILFAVKSLGVYLRLLCWPYPLRFYYGTAIVTSDVSFADPDIWIALLLPLAALWFCVKSGNRTAWFGLLFFVISIAPFLNFVRPVAGIIGDRLAFAPSFGFVVCLTSILFHFGGARKYTNWKFLVQKPFVYISVLLPLCVVYVWNRNTDWHDEVSLFEHDAPVVEHSAGANNLIANKYAEFLYRGGGNYTEQELVEKCWLYYQRSVNADSSIFSAMNNAGTIAYRFRRDPALAIKYFSAAIRVEPNFPQAYENLADCKLVLGDTVTALNNYRIAIGQNPMQYNAYLNAGRILYARHQYEQARRLLEKGKTRFPMSTRIHIILAQTCNAAGDKKEAIANWEKVYEQSGDKSAIDSLLMIARNIKDTAIMEKYLGLY